jgi:hypothetical protein
VVKVIEFPGGRCRSEFVRDAISFEAFVDGNKVLCVATAELLMDRFRSGHTEGELLRCALQNMNNLHAAATTMIHAGNVTSGEVLLTTSTYRS